VTGEPLLVTRCQDAAPARRLSWLSPNPPWSVVACAALGCAVVAAVSTVLGLLILLLSAPLVAAWPGGHCAHLSAQHC